MWAPKNYSVVSNPDGGIKECDTFTCGHCQKNIFVPPGQSAFDLGGGCKICHNLICPRCVDLGRCQPFEAKALAIERKAESDLMWGRLTGRE